MKKEADRRLRFKEEKEVKQKQKRHFILTVILMTAGLLLGGQVLGEMLVLPFRQLLPEDSAGVRFLFLYLEFIGIDLLVLLYCIGGGAEPMRQEAPRVKRR